MIRHLAALIALLLPACELRAPQHQPRREICIDWRPALKLRAVRTFAKLEGCPRNQGCLRAADGSYPRYPTEEAGERALTRWVERHSHLSVKAMVQRFNSAGREKYLRDFLSISKLDAEIKISEATSCR